MPSSVPCSDRDLGNPGSGAYPSASKIGEHVPEEATIEEKANADEEEAKPAGNAKVEAEPAGNVKVEAKPAGDAMENADDAAVETAGIGKEAGCALLEQSERECETASGTASGTAS